MNLLNFNKHSYEACIVAVKKDGNVLQYIEDQTPDMCLMAVNQDGHALQHVKERTPEICMAAVNQDDMALQYIAISLDSMYDTIPVCLTYNKKRAEAKKSCRHVSNNIDYYSDNPYTP